MSSNILLTHSHDATKSTNTINYDMNTTSSDRTFTHINDGQKKGGKAHRHRRLEEAPVVYKAMVSHSFLLL